MTWHFNYCPSTRTFLKVDSMVVTWWIVAFLCCGTFFLSAIYVCHSPPSMFISQTLWGNKRLNHAYPHKPLRKIKVAISNHQADCSFYLWPNVWSGDLQIQNRVCTWHWMWHCPYWNQMSLNSTKTQTLSLTLALSFPKCLSAFLPFLLHSQSMEKTHLLLVLRFLFLVKHLVACFNS